MQKLELTLTVQEVNTILEALGTMPYTQVHQLISSIQEQAQKQLQADKPEKGKA